MAWTLSELFAQWGCLIVVNNSHWLSLIDNERFAELFIEELGWNQPISNEQEFLIASQSFSLIPIANFKGIQVWSCSSVPSSKIQREIDKELSKISTERLTIFYDSMGQNWRWPMSRESTGKGIIRLINHEHVKGNNTQSLLQRLQSIQIDLSSEEPSLVEMLLKLRRAFDADQVTKKFYREFSDYQNNLVSKIEGLESLRDKEWYSSLLLNRIMFIYFMQWKGFMDGDQNYLGNRLNQIKSIKGPNQFFGFFQDFLLPLFHKGLGAGEAITIPPEISSIVGKIPYVNGGIFSEHELEIGNDINIPDSAFAQIFSFFDNYQWHLDSRRTGNPNEINPDVLGYVFEQFINNKEVGAYYTKEDITEYMTSNTLVTNILYKIQEKSSINILLPLVANPERYVWPSLKYGEERRRDFERLMASQSPDKKSPEEIGLPGETCWETYKRFEFLENFRSAISSGKVNQLQDLVKWNIDLETLLIDLIDGIDTSEDVLMIWRILESTKIIDPTCGSGAFLFAALNQLEAIYAAILDIAEIHARTGKSKELVELLKDVAAHPSRNYFILKFSSQKNLFGVDLMPEATEIARLRLFLKLISTIEDFVDIEPLPDLEFNIKSGNLLIGITQSGHLDEYFDTLDSSSMIEDILNKRDHLADLWDNFAEAQERSHAEAIKAKKLLTSGTAILRQTLNELLYKKYSSNNRESLNEWINISSPFHWFIEFPEVFQNGGFDVVIGNPPYIAKNKVTYSTLGHKTSECPDIYAMCMERACQITKPDGTYSMIVMSSLVFSSKYKSLRQELSKKFQTRFISGFAKIPAALFEGVRVRNTIFVGMNFEQKLFSAPMHRWNQEYRPHLMSLIRYHQVGKSTDDSLLWPFVTSKVIADKLCDSKSTLRKSYLPKGPDLTYNKKGIHWDKSLGKMMPLFYKTNAYNRISVALIPPPVEDAQGKATTTTAQKLIWFKDEESRDLAFSLFNTKWIFTWWAMYGDDLNVTQDILLSFPVAFENISTADKKELLVLSKKLHDSMTASVKWKRNAGLKVGSWDVSNSKDILTELDLIWAKILGFNSDLSDLNFQYFSTVKTVAIEFENLDSDLEAV